MGNVYYLSCHDPKRYIQLDKDSRSHPGQGWSIAAESIVQFMAECAHDRGSCTFTIEGDYFEPGEMMHEKDGEYVEVKAKSHTETLPNSQEIIDMKATGQPIKPPTFMEQMSDGTWRPTDRNTGVVYWPDAPLGGMIEPRGTSMLRPLYAEWTKPDPPGPINLNAKAHRAIEAKSRALWAWLAGENPDPSRFELARYPGGDGPWDGLDILYVLLPKEAVAAVGGYGLTREQAKTKYPHFRWKTEMITDPSEAHPTDQDQHPDQDQDRH